MRMMAGIGSFLCFFGLLVLGINVIGDSGTPTVTHIDVLGLAMSISGAVLARGSEG